MNYKITAAAVVLALTTACSGKIKLKYIEPPRVDLSESKRISVLSFNKDEKINLRQKVEAALSSHFVRNKPYFTIVERGEIEKIIREEQGSEWSSESVAGIRITGNANALAVVIGTVMDYNAKQSYHHEKRRKCSGKNCYDTTVSCRRKDFFMEAQLKVIDIRKKTVSFAKIYSESDYDTKCSDGSNKIRSDSEGIQNVASKISRSFVGDIAPEEKEMEVAVMDSPDIDLSDEQEDEFDRAMDFAKANRTDRAYDILLDLNHETKSESYVILYNLGVMEECRGKYKTALSLFDSADRLTVEPVEELGKSLERIKKKIAGVPIEPEQSWGSKAWKKIKGIYSKNK